MAATIANVGSGGGGALLGGPTEAPVELFDVSR